ADKGTKSQFGESVAVSADGSTAIVGDWAADDAEGTAYVFERDSGWSQQATLTSDDGSELDNFGRSVAVSGDGSIALLGARGDDEPNGDEGGSAYIFERTGDGWEQRSKIAAKNGTPSANFGRTVAQSGDGNTVLVGSGSFSRVGAVHVFEETDVGWVQSNKLPTPDDDSKDNFAFSVAVSDDGSTALVGAHGDDDPNGEMGGSAYVFEESDGTLVQVAKLAVPDGGEYSRFGISVAVADGGTKALVGTGGGDRSAYIFDRTGDGWSFEATLSTDDPEELENAIPAASVAMAGDGTIAFVGTPPRESDAAESIGTLTGSVSVYEETGNGWTRRAKIAPEDVDARDLFGWPLSVSDDGTTAVVGAPGASDTIGVRAGSAYVLELE
ncbi:MAG: hypothetical protein ACI8XM_001542, partial [Haloarculaceae archaeon]